MTASRIVGHADLPLDQIKPNPDNYREHPDYQAETVDDALSELGWVKSVIWNETTGHLIDGHLRLQLAQDRGERTIPAEIVELTEEEERLALALLDTTTEAAIRNATDLNALLDKIQEQELSALREFLADLYTDPDDLAAEHQETARRALKEQFLVPPFTVLDGRQGYWKERKAHWLALGISSELGRAEELTYGVSCQPPRVLDRKRAIEARDDEHYTWQEFAEKYPEEIELATTSIFDPVLTEIVYRWFCPPEGRVLDPFAGGSVRGIVAAITGRNYTGIELRAEQVAANQTQGKDILADAPPPPGTAAAPESYPVKISAKMARLRFHGCEPDYIRNVCKARCCHSTKAPSGIIVTIHPTETAAIEAWGGRVEAGLLQPREGERRCPFKAETTELCALHTTPDKPFGCIASPFTLNDNDTLIVRHRYKSLKCYKDGNRPAYRAFAASLERIFGADEAERITAHFDAGGDDLHLDMPADSYHKLHDNDATKRPGPRATEHAPSRYPRPIWRQGDSRHLPELLPDDEPYDLLFTCPPYADLERYSDDAADLSTLDYQEFLPAYREIIAQGVSRLAPDSFAAVVVGEIRDNAGNYRGFVKDTIDAFTDAGLAYYNEAIFITPGGSLPMRASRAFNAGRKLGKHHQNLIVFKQGEPRLPDLKGYATKIADHLKEDRRLIEAHQNLLLFVKGDPKAATAKTDATHYEDPVDTPAEH